MSAVSEHLADAHASLAKAGMLHNNLGVDLLNHLMLEAATLLLRAHAEALRLEQARRVAEARQ